MRLSVPGGTKCAVLALLLSVPFQSLAAETDQAPAARAEQAAPLSLIVATHGNPFDADQLRQSLSRELGREVTLTKQATSAAVQVDIENPARAHVRYVAPNGELVEREIDLPPDRERSVQVLSWLTVNLVRDEASELLDELRARRRAEEERALADKAAADKAAADKAAAAAADLRRPAEARRTALSTPPVGAPPLIRDWLRSVDLALATPVSILRDSHRRELKLQLALAYGDAGGVSGVAISPSVLRIRRDLVGVSAGAAATIVGGNARGMLASVGYAHVEGQLAGLQLGVGAALQRGKLARGVVGSVGGAIAGDVEGAIFAAGVASARSLEGIAVAGGITFIRGSSQGALVAGGINVSHDLRGIEVAGGINVARDLAGIAIAPLNVHRKVRGLQIGVVNVAEEVEGAQIGVLSFSKQGRFQPVLWGGSDGSVHLALKSISGFVFTQLGAGLELEAAELSYDGGIGAHLKLSESWFLEPGVHYSGVLATESASSGIQQHRLHYLALLGLRVSSKLDLLAGGGVRQAIDAGEGLRPELRAGLAFF